MLKKIGSYNDFPKDFKQPKLKKGETVIYRLLNSVTDPNRPGQVRFPASVKIRSVDRVRISEDESDTYDIGLVRQIDKEGIVQGMRHIKIAAQEEAGYFRVVGGNLLDEELYVLLELTNLNLSNPLRDESIEPLFQRIDEEKEATDSRKKRSARLSAMTFAANMNLAAVKDFAASRNWEQNDKEEVLRQRIEKLAETEPEAFMRSVNDKDLIIRATIKRAVDKGTIRFDIPQSKWVWKAGGETICVVAKSEGLEPFDGLVDFIKTNKKGDAVYVEIAKGEKKEDAGDNAKTK